MKSAVICYAGADKEAACELERYLRLNYTSVIVDSEAFEAPEDFLAAERALSGDFPPLLLSPRSIPRIWQRTEWEPIRVDEARRFNRQVAYIILENVNSPRYFAVVCPLTWQEVGWPVSVRSSDSC